MLQQPIISDMSLFELGVTTGCHALRKPLGYMELLNKCNNSHDYVHYTSGGDDFGDNDDTGDYNDNLVCHPGLHKSSGVMKYNFSDHSLVYTEFEFNVINQKGFTHNVVKFRDMKRFNPEIFLNDLNSCEVLNGSLYDEDISWEKLKLKFNEICNKKCSY